MASALNCKIAAEVVLSELMPESKARSAAEKIYDLVAQYTREGLDERGKAIVDREFQEMVDNG